MARAGCNREVFASDATVLLHEATVGAMRDLDRLAAASLRETARKKRKLVERDVVERLIEGRTLRRDRPDRDGARSRRPVRVHAPLAALDAHRRAVAARPPSRHPDKEQYDDIPF